VAEEVVVSDTTPIVISVAVAIVIVSGRVESALMLPTLVLATTVVVSVVVSVTVSGWSTFVKGAVVVAESLVPSLLVTFDVIADSVVDTQIPHDTGHVSMICFTSQSR
jgi:hypothetical protein